MQISIDTDQFDALQIRGLEEIIRSVASELKAAGITDDAALSNAVGNSRFRSLRLSMEVALWSSKDALSCQF